MRTTYTGWIFNTAIMACVCASLAAQRSATTPAHTVDPSPAKPALSFSGEPYVIKTATTVVSMNADGTGTRVLTFAAMLQSEAALRESSVVSVAFASHAEHADFVYVRVVHTDGTIEETPVSSAIEQPAPVTQQAPLYSDLETKQLPVRSLRVGDTLEWQARFTIDHPEVPNQSWGQDSFIVGTVVLDETYELRVPSTLHPIVWTNPAAQAEFTESDAAGTHIYRWRHSALRPTVGPQAEAYRKSEETRRRTPQEELDETKGALPSFAWSTFHDWPAVGDWYRSLVVERAAPDDAIKAKVAELTAGKTTDLEKAQAVYSYVSNQIRYIGVDFGVGRYQPHTAAEVFANRYGDCKDKHTLLAAMLSVLNLHADPVLIGVGIRFNPAVPSPSSFNHLITRLTLNGQPVWLDATSEIGTWGALLKPVRDQDALAIPSGAAVIAHTPVDLPYPQVNTFAVAGSLDPDLTSDSKIIFTLHDDAELYLRAALHAVSPANYGEFVQNVMGAMGFGGTTSDPSFEHLDDPSQPLQIVFHYRRVKEKDWGDNRITATFQNIGVPAFSPDKPPVSAILLGDPRTEISTVNMQLPEGWNAVLPEAVHAHASFATCDVTYLLKNHVLTAERRLTILKSKVAVDDFKQYQSWYDESGSSGYPYIQLMPPPKVTAAATAAEPKVTVAATPELSPSDPKAADLILQAGQNILAMNLDDARKLLDQAEAINPKQRGLWATYSRIAAMLGMQTKVFEDMERELSYQPDEVLYYPWVAEGEVALGNSKAALALLHAWVKAAPDSPAAAVALGRRLLDDKSPAEALVETSNALERLKSSSVDLTELRIVAADAQVATGHASQAADAVAPLLKTATDLVQINNITYILAEASADLTEADASLARALKVSETETAAWKSADDLLPKFNLQSSIMAAWDTMGWILFHQGKFGEAYGYVNAALHGGDSKSAREHLAAINAVIHNPLAAAALRADDQKLRTFPLGPARGHNGVAFCTLLLADGKVVDSTLEKSANTNALSNGAELLKVANLHALFPPGSAAHLIRTGFVNCHSGICELVLSPFERPQPAAR